MKKSIIFTILVAAIILGTFFFNSNKVKNDIIEKDYNIILKTNCDISLEINKLLLNEDWIRNNNDKITIKNLLDIVYQNSHESSNYEIKDKQYINMFKDFNYFEKYAHSIKLVIEDNFLSEEEKEYIKNTNKDLIKMKSEKGKGRD